MEDGRWRDASPRFTFGDTRVPIVNVGSGRSRESEVLFVLLSECIQVSALALASGFMRSNKKTSAIAIKFDKMKLEERIRFLDQELLIVAFSTKIGNSEESVPCGG